MTGHGSRLDRRWVLGCVALAAALRLFRLGHQSLWIDEMISLGLATYAHGTEFWTGLLRDIHGPFNSALLHLWVRGGLGESWLRLLYVIPSLATVPLAWMLGTELFDRRTGRAAALTFAVSPILVWYAQEARNYSWALLWTTAVLVLFPRVLDGRAGRGTWWLLGALIVLGVLTNYTFVFLLVAMTVLVLVRRPFSRGLLGGWTLVLGCTGLVFLPWFLDWYQRIGAERIFIDGPSPTNMPLREASKFSLADLGYLFWTFTYGYSLGPSLRHLHLDRSLAGLLSHWAVLVPGVIVFAATVLLGLRQTWARGRAIFVLTVCAAPLVLCVLLAVREVKSFNPRYMMVFLPLLLTVLAAGWARRGRLAVGCAAAALALAAVSLSNHYFVPEYAKEDSRSAARLILDNERPGDSVVVIYAFRPFRHYFADRGAGRARLHHVHKRFLRTDDEMRTHVADASRDSKRVWLVLSRWWDVAPEERIRRIFAEGLDEEGRWEFDGVKVTLYEGKTS